MQEIFQHTERIKKEIASKIAETKSEFADMKGQYEDIVKSEVQRTAQAAEVAAIQQQTQLQQ